MLSCDEERQQEEVVGSGVVDVVVVVVVLLCVCHFDFLLLDNGEGPIFILRLGHIIEAQK